MGINICCNKDNSHSKKYVVPLIHWLGTRSLEKAVLQPTWKQVWSAGQSVGLVNEILSVREILAKLMEEYEQAKHNLT